uniref:Uncharacterized protein n=1 Tax=Arundo donax TaxID=35708 RepID=A0A0A9EJD0_ARUDO
MRKAHVLEPEEWLPLNQWRSHGAPPLTEKLNHGSSGHKDQIGRGTEVQYSTGVQKRKDKDKGTRRR